MLKTNKLSIQKIDSLIYRIEFFDGADIELSDAELINDYLTQVGSGHKHCIVLDATKQFTTTPEARAYVGSKETRIAFAIVTNSLANKLVGNFFIKFNKPLSPTKIFSDETTAINWLKEEKAKYLALLK